MYIGITIVIIVSWLKHDNSIGRERAELFEPIRGGCFFNVHGILARIPIKILIGFRAYSVIVRYQLRTGY